MSIPIQAVSSLPGPAGGDAVVYAEPERLGPSDSPSSPLLPKHSRHPSSALRPSSKTCSRLVYRLRALVTHLLPIEVDEGDLTGPTSEIITDEVVHAFRSASEDYSEVTAWALLVARGMFMRDAVHHPADHGLHRVRAIACEVLARKAIEAPVHTAHHHHSLRSAGGGDAEADEDGADLVVGQISKMDRWEVDRKTRHRALSGRFRRVLSDGDVSLPSSALEEAVDQHCTIFLSSPEAQRCVSALWVGHLVSQVDEHGVLAFQPYESVGSGAFLDHFHPSRLSVPKYQYFFNITTWIVFLALYTLTTTTPTDLDIWEVLLYIFGAGYILEDVSRTYKSGGLGALSFWTIVVIVGPFLDITTNVLLCISFALRLVSLSNYHEWHDYQILSFQFLSCIAPLIWIKLLTILDSFAYFGVIQVVILRMLKETATFFTLLILVEIGFAQALFSLDAADNNITETSRVINALIQALLTGPDFSIGEEGFGKPFGAIIYYLNVFIVAIILVNILIAFFGSAYQQVEDNAIDEFLVFFTDKTIAAIRAPDQYVYLPPFNLLEAIFIVPLEFIIPRDAYAKLNKVVQSVVFFIPLCIIALYESRRDAPRLRSAREASMLIHEAERSEREHDLDGSSDEEPETPFDYDDELSTAAAESDANVATSGGAPRPRITKVKWDDLLKRVPQAGQKQSAKGQDQDDARSTKDGAVTGVSGEDMATILSELKALRAEIAQLRKEQRAMVTKD